MGSRSENWGGAPDSIHRQRGGYSCCDTETGTCWFSYREQWRCPRLGSSSACWLVPDVTETGTQVQTVKTEIPQVQLVGKVVGMPGVVQRQALLGYDTDGGMD